MARLTLAAILLAHGALANLDIPPINNLAIVIAAATTTDPGLLACVTAEAILDACFAQPGFTDAPDASQASCLCCYSGTYLEPAYSSCASYISVSAPSDTSDYSGKLDHLLLLL